MSRNTVLVLADTHDALARRVEPGLRACAEVVWLTPIDLVLGRWVHEVGSDSVRSRVRVREQWHDLGLATGTMAGTLNRVRLLPPSPAMFASAGDRDYAAAERHALVLSVLAGLSGTVVNPPSPPSLSGADLTPAGWLRLAASLGLPVRSTSLTTDARRHVRLGQIPAHWPSLKPIAAGVPIGRRPAVWMGRVDDAVQCWVVGESVLTGGSTRAGRAGADRVAGLDLARLARAGDCLLLEVVVARDDRGSSVIAWADPHPPDVPDPVVAALRDLLLSKAAAS